MKKKLVITLLLTALATTSLAGCGKKETATDVPTESTEVVAEVNTEVETETEELVVAETETEEFELFFKTEAENTEKSDEKTTDTKETVSNSGSTSTEKSTDKSADKSTSNTSSSTGNTSSGSTSTSTTTSGNTGSTNSGTTNNTTTNSGSTTTETAPSTQPETPVAETPVETPVAETPAPEPELPSFPYELNTLYENGDGTGCIYIYDAVEDNNDGLMHGMTSMEYMMYDAEQTLKIDAVGGVVSNSERLGHYKEGYIKKINYVPDAD